MNNRQYHSIRVDAARTVTGYCYAEKIELHNQPKIGFHYEDQYNNPRQLLVHRTGHEFFQPCQNDQNEDQHQRHLYYTHGLKPRSKNQDNRPVRHIHAFRLRTCERKQQIEEGQWYEKSVQTTTKLCLQVTLRCIRLRAALLLVLLGFMMRLCVNVLVVLVVWHSSRDFTGQKNIIGLSRVPSLIILGYFNSGVRFGWILRQKLLEVIIDNDSIELDWFPAEGTVGLALEAEHTLPANGVLRGADDHWLPVAAVIAMVADITFVDGGEVSSNGALAIHLELLNAS